MLERFDFLTTPHKKPRDALTLFCHYCRLTRASTPQLCDIRNGRRLSSFQDREGEGEKETQRDRGFKWSRCSCFHLADRQSAIPRYIQIASLPQYSALYDRVRVASSHASAATPTQEEEASYHLLTYVTPPRSW